MKKKIKSEFHVFGWFLGLQNLDVFFGKIYCGASFEIIFRQKQFTTALVFRFSNSLLHGMEESRELRILIKQSLWIY